VSGRLFGSGGGPAAGGAERVPVGSVTFVVYDRGPAPAWHVERERCGPWLRYEAQLPEFAVVREFGRSPWEAVCRLVCRHRGLLERRWSAWT